MTARQGEIQLHGLETVKDGWTVHRRGRVVWMEEEDGSR